MVYVFALRRHGENKCISNISSPIFRKSSFFKKKQNWLIRWLNTKCLSRNNNSKSLYWIIFITFWRTSVFYEGHKYPCFGLLSLISKTGWPCLIPQDTKNLIYDGFLRFTSGATPADLLTTSIAAEPFLINVLYWIKISTLSVQCPDVHVLSFCGPSYELCMKLTDLLIRTRSLQLQLLCVFCFSVFIRRFYTTQIKKLFPAGSTWGPRGSDINWSSLKCPAGSCGDNG